MKTKKYSQLGNRQGKPAYRTPATLRVRKQLQVSRLRARVK